MDKSDLLPPAIIAKIIQELSAVGHLSAKTTREIAQETQATLPSLMVGMLPLAAARASVPVSQFAVGAIALGAPTAEGPGALYLGANIEFCGQPLSASIHAEQAAVNSAVLAGERGLQAIASSAAPCGYCRQFLTELATPAGPLDIVLEDEAGEPVVQTIEHYLPHAFGPAALGNRHRLMAPLDHGRTLPAGATDDPLVTQALGAANTSYAPYSGNIAGVAIETDRGAHYAGRHLENAAFNPSISPLQSALAHAMLTATAPRAPTIRRAVLVEDATGQCSQKHATETLLRTVAPEVRLIYLPLP